MTSEGLDILEEIGYTGVPQREKTTSIHSLVDQQLRGKPALLHLIRILYCLAVKLCKCHRKPREGSHEYKTMLTPIKI